MTLVATSQVTRTTLLTWHTNFNVTLNQNFSAVSPSRKYIPTHIESTRPSALTQCSKENLAHHVSAGQDRGIPRLGHTNDTFFAGISAIRIATHTTVINPIDFL